MVRRREQSAAVWSSSCCLPDQKGQQAWSSWLFLWRCLTDSQQLGPRGPPRRGQAAAPQACGLRVLAQRKEEGRGSGSCGKYEERLVEYYILQSPCTPGNFSTFFIYISQQELRM